jgi:SpoIID/LytB domain protein
VHPSLRWAAVLVVLLLATAVPRYAQQAPPGMRGQRAIVERGGWVRVLIASDRREVTIGLPSAFVVRSGDAEIGRSQANGIVRCVASGGNLDLTLDGRALGRHAEAWIVPVRPGPDGEGFMLDGRKDRRFRGSCRLVRSGETVRVINEIQLDDYLKGVLPAEIGGDAPLEALKAQAICARSEVIHKIIRSPHGTEGYDLCAGVHCMAYKGMNVETTAANDAVDATLGMVLVAAGEVLDAVYHNVCGGITAPAEDVWDSRPKVALETVLDTDRPRVPPDLSTDSALLRFLESGGSDSFCYPDSAGYPAYAKKYFRWEKTLSAEQLARACGVGPVTDIRVIERRPSGRVRKLEVTGTGGRRIIEKELPIRQMFDLWSGLFVLRTSKSAGRVVSATFVGGGNGHGVGLCQQGARVMAARGFKAEAILSHYYRSAQIRRIYRP